MMMSVTNIIIITLLGVRGVMLMMKRWTMLITFISCDVVDVVRVW